MLCPRCNQPMHSRSWRHRDGHVDTWHVCRNHLCRYRWQERRDATDAQVAAMRAAEPEIELTVRMLPVLPYAPRAYDMHAGTLTRRAFDVEADENLTVIARHCFGIDRRDGETDEELRRRCSRELSHAFDSSSMPPGGQWKSPYGALTVGKADDPLPPNTYRAVAASDVQAGEMLTVCTTAGKVGMVRGLPTVLRTVEDIATFLLKTTGIPWDVRRSDERFHVQPLSGALSSVGVVDAVDKLLARVPIFYVVDWDHYSPNVAKVETPPGWTSLSWNGVECPGVAQTTPKPPRPVKVGDVLLNEVGQSARKVLGVERGRLLLCYCGHGVDESVATASYLLDDVLRLGWTHADGAAIAEQLPERRAIRALDSLCNCQGERFFVEAFNCKRYTLCSTSRPLGEYVLSLATLRAEGWTFADTGEKV